MSDLTMTTNQQLSVVEVLEATTGGTRRHLHDVVTHLDPDRYRPMVVASTRRDEAFQTDVADLEARGIPVFRLDMVRPISPCKDAWHLFKLWRLLRHLRPDVVHTHSAKAGVLGRLAAWLNGVPVIIHTPHHFPFEMDVSNPRKAVYLWLERLVARITDRLVCVCEAERAVALTNRVARPEQLVVIENGIKLPAELPDPQRRELRRQLGVEEGELAVGIVARLSPQKGHACLLRALARLTDKSTRIKLIAVGDGELAAELVGLAARLGVDPQVQMVGHRDAPQDLYPAFDIVAIPSLWEALPYVLLDALAAGRPVVATDVGGIGGVV